MDKQELIERLKKANFTTEEINEILLKSEISQEAKDGIAVTEQIEKSAINFLDSFVKSLKSDFKKNLLDILVIILPVWHMRYSALLFISLLTLSCSTTKDCCLEEPKHKKNETYIKHTAYSLVYSEEHKQPDWVSYQLLSSELNPIFSRTNQFLNDTLVVSGTANNTDYRYSGYDKGHLAPAADMTWDYTAMTESFYFSNISPQLPGFNRGIWKKLETKVRDWANTYDCLYISTGSICYNSTKSIGANKISIPTHFFKTVLIYNDSIQQGIGFIVPHEKCEKGIFEYAVSIDSVEKITKLDFYYKLPNRKEKQIESVYDENFWNKK